MRLRPLLAASLLAVALTACDPSTVDPVAADDPAAGTCLAGTEECLDTAPPADPDGDALDEGAVLREAEALLGASRDEVPAPVRIARIGAEQFALTEDYVIGRITVELDAAGDGVDRVVSATVELTEGPHTLTADS